MIFSHEDVAKIPLLCQYKPQAALTSRLIPLLRLVANQISLKKEKILLELQDLNVNKQCLVFEASKDSSLNSERFIDLMSECE